MSEKWQHTPGPYEVSGDPDDDEQGRVFLTGQLGEERVDVAWIPPSAEQSDDAARIRSCLEACAGINPAAVPAMRDALRAFRGYQCRSWPNCEAVRNAGELCPMCRARAALALAEGKE